MTTRPETPAALSSPVMMDQRPARGFSPAGRRQFWLITLGAATVFVGLRLLPTGTNLSHMDFRVDPRAGNAIEFCDPLNPQFIPVVAARSPVAMTARADEPPTAGRRVRATVTLRTASGKPVLPEDLLVTHTRRLHLLIIDPSLRDYQHVHPTPARTAGEWSFEFTPRAGGAYRVFSDFTPAATGRGLYASADLQVAEPDRESGGAKHGGKGEVAVEASGRSLAQRDGLSFALEARPRVPRPGQPIELQFTLTRADGGDVGLEPVMGAYAHLVAFDMARSGFAHLHPTEADLLKQPAPKQPTLNFKLTVPRAGRYVIWSQLSVAGVETFVPFELKVAE